MTIGKLIGISIGLLTAGAPSAWPEENYVIRSEGFQMGFIATARPEFPSSLEKRGVKEGAASFVVSVSEEGELLDVLAIEATHVGFIKAAEAAIWKWEFVPPIVGNKPTTLVEKIDFSFRSEGLGIVTYKGDEIVSSVLDGMNPSREKELRLASLDELDDHLYPIKTEEPKFHENMLNGEQELVVNFTFYIDREGNVRMPSVQGEFAQLNPRLLIAGQQALSNWKFEPPRSKGKSVVVKAIQPIAFKSTEVASN